MERFRLQFERQNDRLSVLSFAKPRKRRGVKHRCLLAFILVVRPAAVAFTTLNRA